jgi:hypothetical protein
LKPRKRGRGFLCISVPRQRWAAKKPRGAGLRIRGFQHAVTVAACQLGAALQQKDCLTFLDDDFYFLDSPMRILPWYGPQASMNQKDSIFLDDDSHFWTAIVGIVFCDRFRDRLGELPQEHKTIEDDGACRACAHGMGRQSMRTRSLLRSSLSAPALIAATPAFTERQSCVG